MKVRFLDVGAAYDELREDTDAAIARVLRGGQFILGPEVDALEREFAAYVGSAHCVTVGNGLDALRLALVGLGVGPGDEVLVPSNTYIATWLAVSQCGATPVPVEPDPLTHNITAAGVEAALTPRSRAIIPVHLYGQPCDMDSVLAVARARGLRVVEDAAQAHGASFRGRRIGSHGDAVCWSFYPGKNLGALGDGGAVTTNDAALAERLRLLRNYGSREKYVNEVQGFNSRLDPLQAAVLRARLPHLDEWNARRRAFAERYRASLADSDVGLPVASPDTVPSWHLFVIRCADRDGLRARLAAAGVETLIHYPIPPHMQRAYAALGYGAGDFPVAERLACEVLSLPMGPHMSESQVDFVCAEVRRRA